MTREQAGMRGRRSPRSTGSAASTTCCVCRGDDGASRPARQIQQRLLLVSRMDCRNAPSQRPCMPIRRMKCSKSVADGERRRRAYPGARMRLDQMLPIAPRHRPARSETTCRARTLCAQRTLAVASSTSVSSIAPRRVAKLDGAPTQRRQRRHDPWPASVSDAASSSSSARSRSNASTTAAGHSLNSARSRFATEALLQIDELPFERLRKRRGNLDARPARRAPRPQGHAPATAAAGSETVKPRKFAAISGS